MNRPVLSFALASLLAACTESSPSTPTPDAGATTDIPNDLATADVTEDIPATPKVDAGPPPPRWPRQLPDARTIFDARGLRAARAIVHAHSVHSHDACDGNPYVDGGPNEPCLQSFRRALCDTRIDVIFLTEHAGHMAEGSFERVMQHRDGDELIREEGALVGYRIACASGHRVLLLPGAENELMPIGLTRHPELRDGDLGRAYHDDLASGAARFRAAGALVAVPHVEQRSIADLRAISPDVLELYNIHANLDPRIAGPHLGFNVGQALADLLRFRSVSSGLDPEWAFLTFFQENQNDLGKWAQLLTDGVRLAAVAASDAHENVLPQPLADGERGDSYRRVFRWFNNELLVRGEVTRASAMQALRDARALTVFETFGTPAGFSYTAVTAGATADVGDTVMLSDGPELRVTLPSVMDLDASLPRPEVSARILRAEASGAWTVVAMGTEATLSFRPTTAGIYRAEARITPRHGAPYLPGLERLVRDVPWVYANPIWVR